MVRRNSLASYIAATCTYVSSFYKLYRIPWPIARLGKLVIFFGYAVAFRKLGWYITKIYQKELWHEGGSSQSQVRIRATSFSRYRLRTPVCERFAEVDVSKGDTANVLECLVADA